MEWAAGICLGFVSPVQVAINAPSPCAMVRVIGVVQAEAFEGAEMSLDGIEPTGVGRGRHQTDIVPPSKASQVLVPMRREVVLDQVKPDRGGIAGSEPPPGCQDIPAGLAFVDGSGETVAMHIVEGQQLLGPLGTAIGRSDPLGMALPSQAGPSDGLELHGTELVETNDRRFSRGLLVEL